MMRREENENEVECITEIWICTILIYVLKLNQLSRLSEIEETFIF